MTLNWTGVNVAWYGLVISVYFYQSFYQYYIILAVHHANKF